jgi:hypothetical protein
MTNEQKLKNEETVRYFISNFGPEWIENLILKIEDMKRRNLNMNYKENRELMENLEYQKRYAMNIAVINFM